MPRPGNPVPQRDSAPHPAGITNCSHVILPLSALPPPPITHVDLSTGDSVDLALPCTNSPKSVSTVGYECRLPRIPCQLIRPTIDGRGSRTQP